MMLRPFLKVFMPFLLSFACGRLILQTDLLFVSRLGPANVAAFSIPMRVMILDVVAAFAIAPVVSFYVASSDSANRKQQVTRVLQLVGILSVALTLIGLMLYPVIASIVVSDSTILGPGKQALFWLTLAIPSRMLQLAAAMVFHGSGQGRKVLWVNVLELFANALLDYLFIFRFGFGFQGGYIGTFICSWLSLGGTLYLLRKQILWSKLAIFDRTWATEFLRKASCELGRLFSERLAALALLWIFSAGSVPTASMSAFAVASELMFFVGIPCIAAMRSVGIILAPLQKESVFQLYQALRTIMTSGLILIFGLSFGIFGLAPTAGGLLYRLSPDAMMWWRPFVVVFSLTLPFKWIGSIQRGVWQSKGDFKTLALLDFYLEWFIVIPLAVLGVRSSLPWLAWSGYLLCDVVLVSTLLLLPGIRSAGISRVEAVPSE